MILTHKTDALMCCAKMCVASSNDSSKNTDANIYLGLQLSCKKWRAKLFLSAANKPCYRWNGPQGFPDYDVIILDKMWIHVCVCFNIRHYINYSSIWHILLTVLENSYTFAFIQISSKRVHLEVCMFHTKWDLKYYYSSIFF